jgi:hypothetical protein
MVNVLSGAPFGCRYIRGSDHADACCQVIPHEAAIVAALFDRYADGGGRDRRAGTLAERAWRADAHGQVLLGSVGGLGDAEQARLRGRACFGKTVRTERTAGLNRAARLTGRTTQRH